MKVKTHLKITISIVGVLVAGLIGFQVLRGQSPDIEEAQLMIKVVKLEDRQITTPPFAEGASEKGTKIQQDTDIESPELGTPPVPENVPTAQSSDAEIREFQAWLSSVLEQEADDAVEETEQVDLNAEDDEIDYDLERLAIESLIQEQWRNSFETYDIRGYMSAIWEDNFFYISDMGTPDNPDDDMIFRGGQQEREGTLKMFNATQNIELNLYKNGDVEFLSGTLAMADYDYDLRLGFTHGGQSNPSGRMVFMLELRENGEWRILEWYDYATPDL
ncbi:hypothetical protein C6503_16985 [Candidatus Poribacteria bacterium]|nr:MAG: hypothetical protein C6503_16985 [Candidatus Poribacteria bacterium]